MDVWLCLIGIPRMRGGVTLLQNSFSPWLTRKTVLGDPSVKPPHALLDYSCSGRGGWWWFRIVPLNTNYICIYKANQSHVRDIVHTGSCEHAWTWLLTGIWKLMKTHTCSFSPRFWFNFSASKRFSLFKVARCTVQDCNMTLFANWLPGHPLSISKQPWWVRTVKVGSLCLRQQMLRGLMVVLHCWAGISFIDLHRTQGEVLTPLNPIRLCAGSPINPIFIKNIN